MDARNFSRGHIGDFDGLVTANQAMLQLIDKAKKVAVSDLPVLLVGAKGVGKMSLAASIHSHSLFKEGDFYVLEAEDCDENILSEKIKNVPFGTFVITDVDQLDLQSQHALLECMGRRQDHAKMRYIFTSTVSLSHLVKVGKFLEKLYVQLSQVNLEIPPLHKRREDIGLLIQYFIGEYNGEFNKKVECVSNVALSYLISYTWPGNIEELRSVVKTAVALSERTVLWLEDIPLKITLTNDAMCKSDDQSHLSLKHMEKEHIDRVLQMFSWNKSKAAKALKISRPRLDRKIQEFHLKKS